MDAPTRGERSGPQPAAAPARAVSNPWNALWAMMIGFFMILLDSTIVAVANPSIMESLGADYEAVIWVTSAYLLAYAVPLLVAGRLGDQFGPKNVYLVGLAVFTAGSLWCGLAGSIEILITARVVQGIGAALLTPQTLSTITRIFPPDRRGAAMSVWGATAGVATLVGPLAGGVLVDHLGWQWIFIVNVPIGVIGVVLAAWLVPALPTHRHRFDVLGVLLSGTAMFLVVFALQEGESRRWPWWIWAAIGAGVVLMGVFVYWQSVNTREPLVPLRIFDDRDFGMATIAVAVIGFAVTAMIVPVMFYAQMVCGLTPTRSALLTAPMAVLSGVLAPLVGKIIDRVHPTPVIGFGFSLLAIGLTWLSWEMTPTTPIWRLLVPFMVLGVGMAFIWSPLAATATRNLAPDLAGAGSGVYNATRQVGAVLGSAAIAAFMSSRISAHLPAGAQMHPTEGRAALQLPPYLLAPFAEALSLSTLLPALVALAGVLAAMFLVGSVHAQRPVRNGTLSVAAPRLSAPAAVPSAPDLFTEGPYRRSYVAALRPDVSHPEGYVEDDDDGYVEFSLRRTAPELVGPDNVVDDADVDDATASVATEPLAVLRMQPAPLAVMVPETEFRLDSDIGAYDPVPEDRPGRHRSRDDVPAAPAGRHHRDGTADIGSRDATPGWGGNGSASDRRRSR